jgi:exonuclease III
MSPITVMTQNLQHGGFFNDAGEPDERWTLLRARIREARPDILMLQEVAGWQSKGHRVLYSVLGDLDMDAVPLAPARSENGTGLLYRKETVGRPVSWDPRHAEELAHGFAVTSFDLGLDRPVSFISVHLCWWSAIRAEIEAQLLVTRGYSRGPYVILGGDCNYAPDDGVPVGTDRFLPFHFWMRMGTTDAGMEIDRRPARAFKRGGLTDVAEHVADTTGDLSALDWTVADCGRIDQLWVSTPIVPSIGAYRRLGEPLLASDHDGICAVIETDSIDRNALASATWTKPPEGQRRGIAREAERVVPRMRYGE